VSVKQTYPTPDSGLTHLFDGRSCSLHSVRLVKPDCTRGVIDPLYRYTTPDTAIEIGSTSVTME